MTRAVGLPTSVPTSQARILRARYVFPVTGEPVRAGMVAIQGERIVGVGRELSGAPVVDLGNVAILPGLINAHTHLEFSDLPEPLGRPGISFVEWIEHVIAYRMQRVQTPGQIVAAGLRESARQGVTVVGEIAQPGWDRSVLNHVRLRGTVFLELIGPTTPRAEAALDLARQYLQAGSGVAGWLPGLSPHAPYTVRPELLSAAVTLSAAQRVPIAFHLAESREERELLGSGTGPLRALLESRGSWEPGMFAPGRRPLDHLRALATAHRALVIHGNYLDDEEIALLARHADHIAVVYCPRTHAWFQHKEHPLRRLLAAKATVALGTDSRASSPDLSLLAEMRWMANAYPDIGRDTVLHLGTLLGARALDVERDCGSLEPGKYADLAIVALPDGDAADPHELLFQSPLPVVGRWYHGVKDEAPTPN